MNYCVLIPSYNEAKNVGGLVEDLKKRDLTVYVIDDGSSDDTAFKATRAGAIVVRHQKNMGKGASLREGFRHAVKKGFDAVLVMDGDGQHKVSDIDKFVRQIEELKADVVIGNRMTDTAKMPLIRILTNKFMSGLLSIVSGQSVIDTQCGFRMIRSQVLRNIELKSSNFEIESEMIVRASRAGFRIVSVPIETVYLDEESKINPFTDTLRFIWLMIRMLFGR